MGRKEIYECFNDEVKQCDEDLAEGKITQKQYDQFIKNLNHNLDTDLSDTEGAAE